MNSIEKELKEYQQIIVNIICYTLWLYERKLISERTKNELLKMCRSSKEGEKYESKHR